MSKNHGVLKIFFKIKFSNNDTKKHSRLKMIIVFKGSDKVRCLITE